MDSEMCELAGEISEQIVKVFEPHIGKSSYLIILTLATTTAGFMMQFEDKSKREKAMETFKRLMDTFTGSEAEEFLKNELD